MEINIKQYYEQYGPMVLRRCRWLLNDEEKALDAMQDVFVQLLRKQKQIKGDHPSSLLYRIATNICLNIIRHRKTHPETKNEEIINNIAHYDDFEKKTIANDILDRIFSKEKETTKTIAMLHYIDGLTLQETAGEMNMSVSGIRKRLRNLSANAKLHQEVERYERCE